MQQIANVLKGPGDVTKLHVNTSYELITKWIDKGYTLGLSSNAIQLMTVLLRFYNPQKKFVFPHQEKLQQLTNTSLSSVARGLNELIKGNLIIKMRRQSGNVYAFTGTLFELLDSSNCAVPHVNLNCPTGQIDMCMIEHDKEHDKQHAVAVTLKKQKVEEVKEENHQFDLDEIPNIIRTKKSILNVQRYWKSLTPEVKLSYWNEEKELTRREKEREEYKKEEKRKREKEKEEFYHFQSLPLHEQFSKEQAIQHVWCLRHVLAMKGYQVKEGGGLLTQLISLYGLNVKDICGKSKEEIEAEIESLSKKSSMSMTQ